MTIILNKLLKEVKKKVDSIRFTIRSPDYEEINVYFNKYKHIIIDDVIQLANESDNINNNEVYMLNDNSYIYNQETIILLIYLHIARRVKLFSKFREVPYEGIQGREGTRNNYWYRGHSSTSWNLIPSLFRHIKGRNQIVDYNFLEREYRRTQILDRVNDVIYSSRLDYDQLSYIQHSISFSPLLDFSNDYKSSRSFAVGDLSNPFVMYDDDAALFELSIENKNIIKDVDLANNIIENFKVEYFNTKISIITLIRSSTWKGFLDETIFSEYYLIDIKTNDRMRIQSGTFVLFDNIIIIGNDMLFSPSTKVKLSRLITKYIINSTERVRLFNEINQGSKKYQIHYMLNPYEFIKE